MRVALSAVALVAFAPFDYLTQTEIDFTATPVFSIGPQEASR